LKDKNAFEASGNSPTPTVTVKVSESGATIQTGRGLEETKRRIVAAFEKIRQYPAQYPVRGPLQGPPQAPQQFVYTPHHVERFERHAQRLALASLENSFIAKAPRNNVWTIEGPSQTPEELYKAALRDK
jgi:hypothetical protein